MSWLEDFDNSVCTAEQLGEYFGWDDETVKSVAKIAEMFPMRITEYYLSLIDKNDPDDPIARMCIPSDDEVDRLTHQVSSRIPSWEDSSISISRLL